VRAEPEDTLAIAVFRIVEEIVRKLKRFDLIGKNKIIVECV
jgi:hypothetical protein